MIFLFIDRRISVNKCYIFRGTGYTSLSSKSRIWEKGPEESRPTFVLKIPEFPYNTVWNKPRVASNRQNELDSFSRFDTIPTCDGQTDGQTYGPS